MYEDKINMIRVSDLRLDLNFSSSDLLAEVSKKLRISIDLISEAIIVKKSIDARNKSYVNFTCAADVKIKGDECKLVGKLKNSKIQIAKLIVYDLPMGKKLDSRPIVVGFGPAGMFAALILAQCGQKPIVIERGESVEKRAKTVDSFWNNAKLNLSSNVQFGEGGAGTFSDGKLTTGTNDMRIKKVLDEFVKAGAPEEILVDAKPHIGTDNLPKVVKTIRETIISLGGEVFFETQLIDFSIKENKICAVKIKKPNSSIEQIECNSVVLAIGHSARDTFEQLKNKGVPMQPKAFSVGARIEHSAKLINSAQYGNFANSQHLGAAEYKLSHRLKNGRGVYTFCMCPGGYVTGAASEEGGVVTNGMSKFARDAENSNAALLVGVEPKDFGSDDVLAGVEFQRIIEQKAFECAGGDYSAPAQRVEDFLLNQKTTKFGDVKPTYMPGVVPAQIDCCLPNFVTEAMREGIVNMNRYLKSFNFPDALLTAPETRSSSPVRIMRGENLQSVKIFGLYPCGEGAGYAGGIVSAAVDGIKCAEKLIEHG